MKIEKLKMTRMHNLFIIALSAMCVACGGKNQGRQQTVPEFAVITLQPETVKLTSAYPATFKGRQDVEIRPNVSGFITKLCVDEGSSVQKGQTLFVIDPVQYEEAVNVAKAAVEVAKANVATAELTAKNKRQLEQRILSVNSIFRQQKNALASSEAAGSAKAQLTNAEKISPIRKSQVPSTESWKSTFPGRFPGQSEYDDSAHNGFRYFRNVCLFFYD